MNAETRWTNLSGGHTTLPPGNHEQDRVVSPQEAKPPSAGFSSGWKILRRVRFAGLLGWRPEADDAVSSVHFTIDHLRLGPDALPLRGNGDRRPALHRPVIFVDEMRARIAGKGASRREKSGRESREDQFGGCFHTILYFRYFDLLRSRWFGCLYEPYSHVPCQRSDTRYYCLFIKHL